MACDKAAQKLDFILSFEVVGSAKFEAAFPSTSDIDTVAILRSKKLKPSGLFDERFHTSKFFNIVSSFICDNLDASAKIRIRSAHGGRLDLVTFRFHKNLPPIDLLVAFVDETGIPRSSNSASVIAHNSDSNAIIKAVETAAVRALNFNQDKFL